MAEQGWKRLTTGAAWFRSPGEYPIAAYSEFMPPPRLGRKPYDRPDDPASAEVFDPADPWGWKISAYEEALELQPGLLHVGEELLGVLRHLGRGEAAHGIARYKLRDNPYWPEALDRRGAAGGTLRRPAEPGPFPHPGRQGPRPLDALRGQPPGTGAGVLAGIFRGAAAGIARPMGREFPGPAPGGRL